MKKGDVDKISNCKPQLAQISTQLNERLERVLGKIQEENTYWGETCTYYMYVCTMCECHKGSNKIWLLVDFRTDKMIFIQLWECYHNKISVM